MSELYSPTCDRLSFLCDSPKDQLQTETNETLSFKAIRSMGAPQPAESNRGRVRLGAPVC